MKENLNSKFSTSDQSPNPTLIAQSTNVLKQSHDTTKFQACKNQRYISAKLKHNIWHKDRGQCTKCNSVHNLQFDHIKPLALGGSTEAENLRLLCFHCNQRQRIKAGLFG